MRWESMSSNTGCHQNTPKIKVHAFLQSDPKTGNKPGQEKGLSWRRNSNKPRKRSDSPGIYDTKALLMPH